MSTTTRPPRPDGATAPEPDDRPDPRQSRARNLRPVLWRLHFLGGFLAGPIVLSLAVTGILFAWHPQIDAVRLDDVLTPTGQTASVSLADQAAAAQAAHPDWPVFSVTPGNAEANTVVLMDPPGGVTGPFGPPDAVAVHVDQATGQVTGEVGPGEDAGSILRSWHSSWSIGPAAEPLTELAGSWFLVSLLTGLVLWWPIMRKRGRRALVPRLQAKGRTRSRDLHNVIGVALLVPMAVLVVTGLTWTQYAGARFEAFSSWLDVQPLAASPVLASSVQGTSDLDNLDAAHAAGLDDGLPFPITITPPADDATAWRVASQDETWPLQRDTLLVEPVSGDVVAETRWADEAAYTRLSTGGVLFHEASLFGVAGQVAMTVLALGVIALVFYGYRMWWQRRPKGSLGIPDSAGSLFRATPVPVLVISAIVMWLLPVLGVALLGVLALEGLVNLAQRLQPEPSPWARFRRRH